MKAHILSPAQFQTNLFYFLQLLYCKKPKHLMWFWLFLRPHRLPVKVHWNQRIYVWSQTVISFFFWTDKKYDKTDSIKGSEFSSHIAWEGWMEREWNSWINLRASVQIHGCTDPEQRLLSGPWQCPAEQALLFALRLCSKAARGAPISLMAWPDVTLARSVCLSSTFSIAHLLFTEK